MGPYPCIGSPRLSVKKTYGAPWGGPFVFLFNGEGEQPPSPMGGTVAGPFLWSQAACFTGVPTPPVSRQGGSLGPGSRKLWQRGSRVGGTDRPPHQKVLKVLSSIAADWPAAVDTSGVLRVGWAPRPSRSATGTSEAETLCRACAEHSGSGGPLGPIFYGRAWVPTPQADAMSMGVHGICCSHVPPEVII